MKLKNTFTLVLIAFFIGLITTNINASSINATNRDVQSSNQVTTNANNNTIQSIHKITESIQASPKSDMAVHDIFILIDLSDSFKVQFEEKFRPEMIRTLQQYKDSENVRFHFYGYTTTGNSIATDRPYSEVFSDNDVILFKEPVNTDRTNVDSSIDFLNSLNTIDSTPTAFAIDKVSKHIKDNYSIDNNKSTLIVVTDGFNNRTLSGDNLTSPYSSKFKEEDKETSLNDTLKALDNAEQRGLDTYYYLYLLDDDRNYNTNTNTVFDELNIAIPKKLGEDNYLYSNNIDPFMEKLDKKIEDLVHLSNFSNVSYKTKINSHYKVKKESIKALDQNDNDITNKFTITTKNNSISINGIINVIDITKIHFKYELTSSLENNKPQLTSLNVINWPLNKPFNPIKNNTITASDLEDDNISSSLKVVSNNVDVTKSGEYIVKYKVSDSSPSIDDSLIFNGNISLDGINYPLEDKSYKYSTQNYDVFSTTKVIIKDINNSTPIKNNKIPTTGSSELYFAISLLTISIVFIKLKKKA